MKYNIKIIFSFILGAISCASIVCAYTAFDMNYKDKTVGQALDELYTNTSILSELPVTLVKNGSEYGYKLDGSDNIYNFGNIKPIEVNVPDDGQYHYIELGFKPEFVLVVTPYNTTDFWAGFFVRGATYFTRAYQNWDNWASFSNEGYWFVKFEETSGINVKSNSYIAGNWKIYAF